MTIRGIVRDQPVPVLYGLMIVSLAALLPLPPLLQDPNYHKFADQRELFGIPNLWNVVLNLPFIAVGAAGLLRLRRDATTLVLFTRALARPLSPESGRLHVVLGSVADDAMLHGNPSCYG